jgi:arabinofuranosyltransferase
MWSTTLRTRLAYSALLLGCVGLFCHQLAPFLRADFVEDDAFISLRYAKRLVEGDGLTWTDGERVEGYSNFLWVLSEAALGAIGVDWFVACRVLGFTGMALAFASLAWYFRPGRARGLLPGAFALGAFCISAPIVISTASGLETPFLLGFLGAALVLLDRSADLDGAGALRWAAAAGVPLGLLAINRPDGMLFTVAFGMGMVFVGGLGRLQVGRLTLMGLIPALLFGAQLAFRLVYYGDWVPNTAHVKVTAGLSRASEGLSYVLEGLEYQHGIWAFALLAAVPLLRRSPDWSRRGVLLVMPPLLAWTAYLIYTGGVCPLARRWLAPTLMLLLVLGGLGLAALGDWLRDRPRLRVVRLLLALAVPLALAWVHTVQWRDLQINRAIHYDFHWKKKGELFADLFGRSFTSRGQPYLAIDIAGAIPFYLDWPALDMLGLMDRWIATHHPAETNWNLTGHTLGDGAYVLSRQPDIVLFGVHFGTFGGVFAGGQQMHADPRFYEQYRFVELAREDPPSARVRTWLRLESDRVGIVRQEDRVEIPAWFFRKEEDSILLLAEELALPMDPGERAVATGIRLDAGRWSVAPRFTTVPGAFGLALDGHDRARVDGSIMELESAGVVDLSVEVGADAATTRLAGVVLERLPEEPEMGDEERL